MIFLRSIEKTTAGEGYPLGCPSLRDMGCRLLTAPITFLVGENGSGKSTLLEALARAMRLPAMGRADAHRDDSLAAVQPLSAALKLVWNRRPRGGFFLRAEDFFGFTGRVASTQREMREELRRVQIEYADRSNFTKGQAAMAFSRELHELESRYGADPDAQSHGESFLSAFRARMLPGGLYLLDEPEAALSPMRQMALLAMLHDLSDSCQFLIATHSPVLTALPGSAIWSFDHSPFAETTYDALPSVQLLRRFLARPDVYIRELIGDRAAD